jgi:hypothetical protein
MIEKCDELTGVFNIPIYKDQYAEKNTFLIGRQTGGKANFIVMNSETCDQMVELWNEQFINDERFKKLKEILEEL